MIHEIFCMRTGTRYVKNQYGWIIYHPDPTPYRPYPRAA